MPEPGNEFNKNNLYEIQFWLLYHICSYKLLLKILTPAAKMSIAVIRLM
jgi:hypothetical protein